MAFIDITEELQFGYELNRHYCNDMIINATRRISDLLVVRDERAMHHFLKNFIDVGASVATIVKAIHKDSPHHRILDEVNFQVSELLQSLYGYVEIEDETKVTFVEYVLDNAVKIDTVSDLDHIEYVIADELLEWAADTVTLLPRSLKQMGEDLHEQYALVDDFTDETSIEFRLNDRMLILK